MGESSEGRTKRLVIVGGTGVVGGYALRYALDRSAFGLVTVFCLGAYTGAVTDAQLRAITVNYTIEFATVLRASSPDTAFSFLSGSGADRTGRPVAFARYKGEAENALLASGFPRLYIFRPAYIYPVEPRKEPNFSHRFMREIYPVFWAMFPNQVIRADDLVQAMVNVDITGTVAVPSQIFENRDIRSVVCSYHRLHAEQAERASIRV